MTDRQEYTGGSVSYYKVDIVNPTSGGPAYTAECNDIIEALGMTYAEGNAFKAIWRMRAAKTLGKMKKGYVDGLYDAEKVQFFGGRMVAIAKGEQSQHDPSTPSYPYLKEVADHMKAVSARDREICRAFAAPARLSDDGWIEWRGGECPVSPLIRVDARFSDGGEVGRISAQYFPWAHKGSTYVVAYRLSGEQA